MAHFHEKLSSESLKERMFWASILFLLLFFGVTILSFYLFPEGLLKNKNPLQAWEPSESTLILTLQIFFYNLLSVLIIVLAGLFGTKKEGDANYLSVGYQAFYTLICIDSIVLGTWSFSIESQPVNLTARLLRTFDLVHRAGLWEMAGQLLITCSTAHIAVILSCNKNAVVKKIKDIRLSKSEKTVFITGILLMLIGAVVESAAIGGQVS
ncbi:MAG TPA: hypothetical protein PKX58_02865 [Flexilinea sp.]|nr:hypothetical protein [Flexilinea sp.]HPJ63957.1 hypothetical protein [Flexilinea sp.]HPR70483.1 hypothetical protein [Flexilinea sp.]